MLAIINAELVMKDHYIPDAYILLKDGKIEKFGLMKKLGDISGYEVLDAKGAYVGPGLVDIHTHAGGGHWFYNEPVAAATFMLEHGSTTVLPTLYFDMKADQLVEQMDVVREGFASLKHSNFGGFYMEAPYMNPKFGANRENNPWKGPINKDEYMPLIEKGGEDVRVWVTAPEREGIKQFVIDAKAKNPNVRFSVGHSEATPAEIEELIPYGLCIGTHHTNATGTLEIYPECRGICVDEAVNYNREIYAEIISDTIGIHVNPYNQRLIRKIKGDDRIILISDACVFDGPVPEGDLYDGAVDILFDFAGEIAGSKLTLNQACRNFMKHTGASLVDAFRFASYNPSRAVGLTDRGEIREGLKADLILVDHKMNVEKVIVDGNIAI